MTTWTVDQLLTATHGELVTGERRAPVDGISIDSRQLKAGEAFVAIQGVRFDSHAFLAQAIDRGASCLVVSQVPQPLPRIPTIRVADTTQALGAMAAFHRRRFQIPVIAVTGTCGKTTTKDLIAYLLSVPPRQVLKTSGTQNNHIGLPLTLLKLSDEHDVVIVELGSNHPGEIAYLTRIASPTIAVITNVGPGHLEYFGSLLEVLREKLSLLEGLDDTGTAVVPGDQIDVLLEARSRLSSSAILITFGTSDHCNVQGLEVQRVALASACGEGVSMRVRGVAAEWIIPLPGYHNAENALAALAVVKALGLPLDTVRERLHTVPSVAMRSEVVRCNGITIINDCYNANPLSFARALEMLKDLKTKRRVMIAGDMLELGTYAAAAHRAIGRLAAKLSIDLVVAVGGYAQDVVKGAAEADDKPPQTITYQTVQELLAHLPEVIRNGDGILVKGSRKLQLEQVTARVLEQLQQTGHQPQGAAAVDP